MFPENLKFYFISGESSGDYIASRTIAELKKLPEASFSFSGIGGAWTEKEGIKSLFPIEKISLAGFWEIIPHIFEIKKLINITVEDIMAKKPDILVTVDSPGFTYRVAAKIRKKLPDLKIAHIVAPSVWAYAPGRALKYAKIYDLLLAILPFEPPYFRKVGLKCEYIGHPILEQNFLPKKKIQGKKKIICVTPGSRIGEIKNHTPIFCEALNKVAKIFPDMEAVFLSPDEKREDAVKAFLAKADFPYRFSGDKLKIFSEADFAIAKSGTNLLEISASGTPALVAYDLSVISYFIIKAAAKIKYASLVNIIAGREIIPEFIKFDCTAEKIAESAIKYLSDEKKRAEQVKESLEAIASLRPKDLSPSRKAARILADFCAGG